MSYLERRLNIDPPEGQSAFLWGPRKAGKTAYLKKAFPQSPVYDFQKTDLVLDFYRRPSRLREELGARGALNHPVILDEVQKVPQVLDEVRWLIENRGLSFILCGSSRGNLEPENANLPGGARSYKMFPLVTAELEEPDLLRILNQGLIPSHYLRKRYRRSLSAYLRYALKEHVFYEALVQNRPAFLRFVHAVGHTCGELTNYSNIALECGVSSQTTKEYYQILVDTLLGQMVDPFNRPGRRQAITRAPKFYFFDAGVAGAVTERRIPEAQGEPFEKAFKNFIFTELAAHASYSEQHYEIRFWRTRSGLDVEFILGDGQVAIDVRGTSRVGDRDLRPLNAFVEEFAPQKALVVCNEPTERVVGEIRILPWETFLEALWVGEIGPTPP